MPVVIEGIDLVAIALLLVVVGMLYSIKWWLRPVLSTLASLLGSVPIVGGLLSHLVVRAENAAIGALDDAIKACEGAASSLFDGLVQVSKWVGNTLATLAQQTLRALQLLADHTIPAKLLALEQKITGPNGPIASAAGAVVTYVDQRYRQTLEAVADAAAAIETTAQARLNTEVRRLEREIGADVTDLRRTLERELDIAVGGASETAKQAVERLRAAENAALAEAERLQSIALQDARNAAAAAVETVASTAGTLAGELHTIEGQYSPADLAALLAAIPALAVLVHTIADEAGLGRPECRGKVKDICGVDPAQWAGLLGGLGMIGMTLDFRDLVDTGRELLSGLMAGGEALGLDS